MNTKYTYILLLVILLLLPNEVNSRNRKVWLDSNMHVLTEPDNAGVYGIIERTDDHLMVEVYNALDNLIFKLSVLELTADTCVYDGWQEHYVYKELQDKYRYKDNELVEHIFYKNGREVIKYPLSVGDTIYTMGEHIYVFKEEATVYGVVKGVRNGITTIHFFTVDNNTLISTLKYAKIDYHGPDIKHGKQLYYYPSGRVEKIAYYVNGDKMKEIHQNEDGSINCEITYQDKSNYTSTTYYPSGKTKTIVVSKKGKEHFTYFDEDGNKIKQLADSLNSIANDTIYPEFPGGQEALMQFLQHNVRYPIEAMEARIQGRVVLQFIVEEDGSINDIIIVKPVHKILNAEAIRVIKAMPKWTPGSKDGKPIRVIYTVPISFRMES